MRGNARGVERQRTIADARWWRCHPLALEVTEHRAQRKRCKGCGQSTTAEFLTEVSASGRLWPSRIKALTVYLMNY